MKLLVILLTSLAFTLKVSVKDFKPVFGKWEGTLTYLDYTSGKPYTMPCNINISADKSNPFQLLFAVEYPNEPKANGIDTIRISKGGDMIDDESLISKEKKRGVLRIVTEKNGVDGNDSRKALLRYTYEADRNSFSKKKEVKFEGEEKWIVRHEYKMTR